MTTAVKKIADEVKSLPRAQLDEFLAWLVDYELQRPDATPMNEEKFPPGWDAERVRRLIANYDALDEQQQVALDDLAAVHNPEFLNEIRRIRNEEDHAGAGKDISEVLKRWPIE